MHQIVLSIPINAPMPVGSHVDVEGAQHGPQRVTGRIAARHLTNWGTVACCGLRGARHWSLLDAAQKRGKPCTSHDEQGFSGGK